MTIIHLKNVPVPERCLTKQNPDLSEVIRLHWLQGDDDVCGCIFDGIYVPYFLSRARRVTVSDSVFVFVLCSCRVFRELIDSLSLLILTSENHIFFFKEHIRPAHVDCFLHSANDRGHLTASYSTSRSIIDESSESNLFGRHNRDRQNLVSFCTCSHCSVHPIH